ncbi:E3 ubiquitin-protein ligase RING [Acrasis kona]|uniref:RING-type E3 ubiquitin transferase n=1 Tax=Acrasis kona TaxID=1008807 RepID=A0AAW2YZD1_9EUKA
MSEFFNLGQLFGITGTTRRQSNWDTNDLISRYGPSVSGFVNTLNQPERHLADPRQQQFYLMSGIPLITGNPYLDQFITLSNSQHFESRSEVGPGGVRFTVIPHDVDDSNTTMENLLWTTFQQAQNASTTAPTKKDAIASLPTINMTKERLEYRRLLQDGVDNDACSVCIEDYSINEELTQLPCEHIFHKDCIVPWIQEHNTCPTCRYELPLQEPEEEVKRNQRMVERFTQQGLQIMQIAEEDDIVFDRLYQIRKDIESMLSNRNEETVKRIIKDLQACEIFLDERNVRLEKINNNLTLAVQHQKKNELTKLKFLRDCIKKDLQEAALL